MSATAPSRIMVVDDDDRYLERLTRAFRDRGFEVEGTTNPEEAPAIAERWQPHRIVLDLRMPGMSGLEVISVIRGRGMNMPIVVLTGYGSIPTATEAIRRGATEVMTKPADADEILHAFDVAAKEDSEPEQPDGSAAVSEEMESLPTPSLARVEWEHIQRVLTDCNGNISQTARRLGIHRRSLQRKLQKMPPPE